MELEANFLQEYLQMLVKKESIVMEMAEKYQLKQIIYICSAVELSVLRPRLEEMQEK